LLNPIDPELLSMAVLGLQCGFALQQSVEAPTNQDGNGHHMQARRPESHPKITLDTLFREA
jgi:hypothetical protein